MSKYSTSFKQSVVAAYGDGSSSFGEVSVQFGVDHSTLRKWVALHGAHGLAGLAKKHSQYDAQFKLSVLRRIWEDGLSYRQAAAVFNIRNMGCLADWERRYERGGIEALASRRRGRPRSMPPSSLPEPPRIGEAPAASDETCSHEELLAEVRQLRLENAYLKKLKALTLEQASLKKRTPFKR